MKNFKINIKNKYIQKILKQVSTFDWNKIPEVDSWLLGVNKKEFRKICNYWVTYYNWKKE